MIYTCTTNPSLDYYISLPELVLGKSNRTDTEMYEAGGKGVNVSIVLNNFHIPNIALGFLGGFPKEYYLSFIGDFPYIQPLFTSIKDNTRINIKIMDDKIKTDINAKGPTITDEEFAKFRTRLNNIYAGDYFILSGNIEEEIEDRIVQIIHELSNDNVKIILDTDRHIIDKCLDTKIFAVKLNDQNIKDDIMKEGRYFIEKNVDYVIYSAPHKSSFIFTKNETITCDNDPHSLINATGSSDSLLAGFVYGIMRAADTTESFKYANAAALATSMTNDLASKEKIEELFDTIEVRSIS
ncbi:MAG: hypothetical protein IKS69_07045 [Erysipelotrichaceae bacterium]|nr:hypothetical protein [Erysipelotrichaceae bacterium]